MRTCKGSSLNSPIYSLSFDAEYLFAAVDQNLSVMDFSGYYDNEQKQDYVKKYVYSNCVSLFILMLLSCFLFFFLVFYKSYQSHFLCQVTKAR